MSDRPRERRRGDEAANGSRSTRWFAARARAYLGHGGLGGQHVGQHRVHLVEGHCPQDLDVLVQWNHPTQQALAGPETRHSASGAFEAHEQRPLESFAGNGQLSLGNPVGRNLAYLMGHDTLEFVSPFRCSSGVHRDHTSVAIGGHRREHAVGQATVLSHRLKQATG